jgi:hypothetical protein
MDEKGWTYQMEGDNVYKILTGKTEKKIPPRV